MITLKTERLILRKYKTDDFEAVHSYGSSEENTIYMLFGANTEERTREVIRHFIDCSEVEPMTDYHFAVVLKENNHLIGGCSIVISDDEAEIGWLLHRDYWRQGYGTELARELLRFGFEDLKLHRIISHCDCENVGSYKIMEKIGMRREGVFIDARPPHKLSDRDYSDEFAYAILSDDWEVQKEIKYYNSLPIIFNGFIDVPELYDGVIRLVCTAKNPANPEKKYIPAYVFAICKGSEKIGEIRLRIGYGGGEYGDNCYYGGQIGYEVDEKHRGNGYAGRACKLITPVAKSHNMTKLLITTNQPNKSSARVCEKLGARLIRVARLPEWTQLYQDGQRYQNIFELSID